MQEYSQQFTREYPPELRQEPGLTESTALGGILVHRSLNLKFKINACLTSHLACMQAKQVSIKFDLFTSVLGTLTVLQFKERSAIKLL